MGLFQCVCHPGEYGAHVPPWGLELADYVINLARNDTRQDQLMADITQALADLDQLLSDEEGDIAALKAAAVDSGSAQVQAIADQIEAKISAARTNLATTPAQPPATDPSTPPVVDPTAVGVPAAPVVDPTVPDPTVGPTQ